MSSKNTKPIAIYHEHQDWFRPLFAEFDRRGTKYVRIDARQHRFDIGKPDGDFSLLFNRMSPSAYIRGNGHGIFYTQHYLAALERAGTRVVNGHQAFTLETSKTQQLSLLEQLGLPYPRTRVINHAAQAVTAAEGFRYPVVLKANIGGSGAGIVRFNSREELEAAVRRNVLDLGIDNTALVQEFIPASGGHITRVEVLGGKYLYAIKVFFTGESFDLCPADICKTTGGEELQRSACPVDAPKNNLRVEAYTPPREIVAQVERIMRAAKIEVGGVEYIVDERDQKLYYYDINALSNFVADGPRVVGFDPYARLADYLEQEAR
jgi:biotin carboxylase